MAGSLAHRLYTGSVKVDFVGKRRIWYMASGAAVLLSIISLLREGGWEKPRERAIRYALACLTLAVQLNDQVAEEPLIQVRGMLTGQQADV